MGIFDLPSAWRNDLMPASFRGATFHVEGNMMENGRRIVVHEFPKKEEPYSEDMGRQAIQFTVRGYCITYPFDSDFPLYRRDYRIARDNLLDALEREGPGFLQLPTLRPISVVCQRYRLTEEEKAGGFCVFDMSFVETGKSPFQARQSPQGILEDKAAALLAAILERLAQPSPPYVVRPQTPTVT